MPDGTLLALGLVGAIAVAGGMVPADHGSRAVDTLMFNYGGLTLELPAAQVGAIESALDRFGFYDLDDTPGAAELRRRVHDLRDAARRSARRKRTSIAFREAREVEEATRPLLTLAKALEAVVSTRIPGTSRTPSVSVGDAVQNVGPRAFFGMQRGDRWLVESIGGHPGMARLLKLGKGDRRTTREISLRLRDLENLVRTGALRRDIGIK